MKKLLFLFSVALAACSMNAVNNVDAPKGEQCDIKNGYCIDFGTSMFYKKWTDNWTDMGGKPTDHTLSDKNDNFRLDLFSTEKPCSPQVLGTWALSVKEMTVGNDKALWGRADYYDGSDNPGWEPNPETVCEGDIGGALYSFCSEKNGKTVVICFLQGTKDEALAESIFQTFRWIE